MGPFESDFRLQSGFSIFRDVLNIRSDRLRSEVIKLVKIDQMIRVYKSLPELKHITALTALKGPADLILNVYLVSKSSAIRSNGAISYVKVSTHKLCYMTDCR